MSPLIKNYNQHPIWFVLTGEGLEKASRGGSVSFKGYSDHADAHGLGPGAYIQYVTTKDQQGRDVGKYFTFDESRRRFQVREGEQDVNGITQYNFLKFAPDCEGSPNGTYRDAGSGEQVQQGVLYREMDSNKDAEIALEAESKRTRACSSALDIDEQTLQELAAFIGEYGPPNKLMRMRVYEWASKRPADYFTLLHAGDRALRAIVRKAVADGIFSKKGSVIYWESTVLGDEDEAIGALVKDKNMLETLQKKVDLSTAVKIEKDKRPTKPTKGKAPKEPKTENSL